MVRKLFVFLLVGVFVFAVPAQDTAYGDTRVSEVQRALKDLGYDPGPVDGSWGQRTETAARRFLRSKSYNVSQVFRSNGVDYNRLLRLLTSSRGTQTPSDTRRIELLLAQLGHNPGAQDGRWDSRTTSAARAFGRSRNLRESLWLKGGSVDKAVLINQLLLAARAAGNSQSQQIPAVFFARGDVPANAQLREMELLLGRMGYDPGGTDGYWSERTYRAARQFADDQNIASRVFRRDGTVRGVTLGVLLRSAQRAGHSRGAPVPLSASRSDGGQTAARGPIQAPSGRQTQRIEKLLAELGYLSQAPNRVWDGGTIAAIERFVGESTRNITWHQGHRVRAQVLLGELQRASDERSGSGSSPITSNQLAHLSASDVRWIERRLADLGYDPGNQDGRWDEKSLRAARAFGRARNLPESAWLQGDRVLAYALIRNLKLASRSNTGSSGSQAAQSGFSGDNQPTTVQIREIEQRLRALGFDVGTPNGRWERREHDAARAFSVESGIRDVVFDSQGSIRRSGLMVHLRLAARGGAVPVPASFFARGDRPSRTGVKRLEELLNQLHFDPGRVDGEWDKRAHGAAWRFANVREMQPRLFRDDGTLRVTSLLLELQAADRERQVALRYQPSSSPRANGLNDGEVRRIEGLLAKVGHNPGRVDVYWTNESTAAVVAFASEQNLSQRSWLRGGRINAAVLINQLLLAERALGDRRPSAGTVVGFSGTDRPTNVQIRTIERQLAAGGYDVGNVDGVWGEREQAAARKFAQERNVHTVIFRDNGLISRSALMVHLRIAARERRDGSEATQTAGSAQTPGSGVSRERLERIERLLAKVGHDPGPVDGVWNRQSAQAAASFARERRLRARNWERVSQNDALVIVNQLLLAERMQEAGTQTQTASNASDVLAAATQVGAMALLDGDYAKAIAEFTRAIGLKPDHADSYNYRGRAYLGNRDYASAVADFTRAVELKPDYAQAYYNRGLARERQRRLTAAHHDHLNAMRHDPANGAYLAALQRVATLMAGGTQSAQAPVQQAQPQPAAPAALNETRVALVIGNSRYEEVPSLRNPQGDARAVAASFERLGFSDVTLRFDLGREALIAALRDFSDKAVTADWAVVYYAGHGFEMGGVNYLVPVDAKLVRDTHANFEAVQLDQLLAAMSGARKLRLAILDACRNNPFTNRMQMSGTRSVGRGLGLIEPEGGTLVAYAARHGQVALDGDGTNSPYVNALLQHLNTEKLEINLLFRRVRDTVRQLTGQSQEPYVYGSLPSEELYFNLGVE